MAGLLSSLYKVRKAMQKAQQKAQQQAAQQQQQAAQATQSNTTANTAPKATTADSLVGTFTSKRAVPGTRSVSSNSLPMDDQKRGGGLLGNLREALFSGGVSAGGGVFSFGNRRQNKKGGLFNLFG